MTTPGYSGKPLSVKIGIKPNHRVLLHNAQSNFLPALEPLPEEVAFIEASAGSIDIVLLFTTSAEDLKQDFNLLKSKVVTAGMIWVCWPKKSSGAVTDLNENTVRDIGLEIGWVDVKVCAVDNYWSGLKFVRRIRDRK